MHKAQSLINHVALVLDASYSMKGREGSLIKATDDQIKYLAKRSQELNQETRVSVYRFGDKTIECLIFDMDVARLPSADDLYSVLYENTALIDATLKSQEDLATTSVLYGDHAFLTFVLTDGQENSSRRSKTELINHIKNSEVNWSLGFLVPDERAVRFTESLGVLRDSIAVWNVASATGLNEAVSAIQKATDNFMQNRAKGVRGTRSVFSTGIDAVNRNTVRENLTPINGFTIHQANGRLAVKDFLKMSGYDFTPGIAYYQLVKTETIQENKKIVVVDKKSNKAYSGAEARHLIGLPDGQRVRVRPDHNPKYDIFVQSTSNNRIFPHRSKMLVWKP